MAKRVKRNATEVQQRAFVDACGKLLPSALTVDEDYGDKYVYSTSKDVSVEDLAVLFNGLVLSGFGNHVTRPYGLDEHLNEMSGSLYREENAEERAARLKREQVAKARKAKADAKKKAKELKLLEELQKKYGQV